MPKLNNLVKRIRSKPFGSIHYGAGTHRAGTPPPNTATAASRQASEATSGRLPVRILDEVMSILVSVQWDCWRFMLPAKPLLNLDVAVVSHGDLDHWHQNFWEKDLLLVPWWLRIPDRFSCLKNIYRVGSTVSVGQLEFKVLLAKLCWRWLSIERLTHTLIGGWSETSVGTFQHSLLAI